ncbi:MAG: monothiol bacilliredoxin BrxC family protein [Bacteroidota bacterium]
MSEFTPPSWNDLRNQNDLEKLIASSSKQPVMLFRYNSAEEHEAAIKKSMEDEWELKEPLPSFILDDNLNHYFSTSVCERLRVVDTAPQVMLIVDGEVIYDECDDTISAKKIMLAMRIINRTFKWMETRQQKKAPGNPKA